MNSVFARLPVRTLRGSASIGDRTLIDVKKGWTDVLIDSVCALLVLVPGIGILFFAKLVHKYWWSMRHYLAPSCHYLQAFEFFVVIMMGQELVSDYFAYMLKMRKVGNGQLHLTHEIRLLEASTIGTVCYVSSVLLWRIFAVNSVKTMLAVGPYKASARKRMIERERESEAGIRLRKLETHFPKLYKVEAARDPKRTTFCEDAKRCCSRIMRCRDEAKYFCAHGVCDKESKPLATPSE